MAMPEGRIKTLTNDGFGFIAGGNGDLVFHNEHLEGGVDFDELREGQRVSYTEGYGPKGKRAENVRPIQVAVPRH
jgi:CspA family cold shock protein